MNIAELVTTTLLDSQAGKFMKSYSKDRPLRFEFLPGMGTGVLAVIRYKWDGTSIYIGEVLRHTPNHWMVVTVAARTFYGRDSGRALSTRKEMHPSWQDVGLFRTAKEAAGKLSEMYDHPGHSENVEDFV